MKRLGSEPKALRPTAGTHAIRESAMIFKSAITSLAVATLLLAAQSAQAAGDRGSVQGTVRNAAGQPVVGAFVKLRNGEARLTFMVISQAQGRFEAGDLPAGRYTVQGVGGLFQSAVSAPLSVTAGQTASTDVALSTRRGPRLPAAWPHKVPEAQ